MTKYTIRSITLNKEAVVEAQDEKEARSLAMNKLWEGKVPTISNNIGAGLSVIKVES